MIDNASASFDANAGSGLDRLRAVVMADPALQLELSQPLDRGVFIDRLLTRASERGLVVDREALNAALRPDPLGVAPCGEPAMAERWPEADWLPSRLTTGAEPYIDWTHFAGAPLADPFYGGDLLNARVRPFNWLFRPRISVEAFIGDAARHEAVTPRGLIFHMSRCGSTLVSQMLAVLPGAVAISEAPVIDEALQLQTTPGLANPYPDLLAALGSALGRRRVGERGDLFIKLDSWHTLAWMQFRRAFPAVPWVFLYRDPLEVMASQMRQISVQGVPGMLPTHMVGIDSEGMAYEEYCARMLGRICEAAADNLGAGGLLVNYDELPDAVWTRILPHFGVECTEAERAAMQAVSRQDAKTPYVTFLPDGEAKRREATPRLAQLVDRHLLAAHRRLEGLRAAQTAGAP